MRAFIILLLSLLSAFPSRAMAADDKRPPEIQSRVALIIGNTNYVNALPLKNPVNDANDMCAAFRKLGFEVICRLDIVSKREFKDAIFEFTGKINHNTVAAFYYAGHGLQIDGVNYMVPTGAELRAKSDIEDESVQINYLMRELEGRDAALNIFFIDACRNNPLTSPIRGYVPMLGLASQQYSPRNSIVTMSTGAGQLSLDGNNRNGTFTKNLVAHIGTPNLSFDDMFKAVSKGTHADASRYGLQQEPQITSSYAEKFCLAGCDEGMAARQEALVKTRTAELSRLETTIAATKAKQVELDAQQSLLAKKRAELDALSSSLESVQSRQDELERRRIQVAQRERELDKIGADIKASTSQLNDLETVRLSLLKKQEEVDRMRKSLAVQQAKIEETNKEIQTRSIVLPEKKPKPVDVLPAF